MSQSAAEVIFDPTVDGLNAKVAAKIAAGYETVGQPEFSGGLWSWGMIQGSSTVATNGSVFTRSVIAAAGSSRADATPIAYNVVAVTGADGVKGVALPAADTSVDPVTVFNTSQTESLRVYGVAGGNDGINSATPNGGFDLGPGETAVFIATSSSVWYAAVSHNRFRSKTLTGADALTIFDFGSVVFLDNATGFEVTLPAPAKNARLTIINQTANTSGNHTIVTENSDNIIKGNANSVAGDAGDSGTADDTINFVANQSVAGDKVELISDGTSWFAYATTRVAAGVTFTTAS